MKHSDDNYCTYFKNLMLPSKRKLHVFSTKKVCNKVVDAENCCNGRHRLWHLRPTWFPLFRNRLLLRWTNAQSWLSNWCAIPAPARDTWWLLIRLQVGKFVRWTLQILVTKVHRIGKLIWQNILLWTLVTEIWSLHLRRAEDPLFLLLRRGDTLGRAKSVFL